MHYYVHPSKPLRALILSLLSLLISGISYAQDSIRQSQAVATATAIDDAAAPLIDGELDDAIWARASVIDSFHQIEPTAYATPSERTEVRVLYDREQLYVAIYCYDSEPDKLTATVKSRDGVMPRDDFVRIMLDPQATRRDGYVFEINPLGGRTDGLLQNNSTILTNWNAIWRGQTKRVADGWTAEMAIPFRAVSFDPQRTQWGLDIVRQIKRKAETIRFAPTDSSVVLNDISLAGTLIGLQGLSQGAGLDVQLYGIGRYSHDWRTHSSVRKGEPSATAYYKFTSALTGTLTYNPDFSDTPLDTRRVNTTRFSLFDAETREFFLQDAAAFEFGGRGFSISNNGQPFFSRNIGLVRGVPVGVELGGKLSGELGPVRVGILSAQTEATATAPRQTLSVARIAAAILDESSLGAIVTHGDPTGLSRNTVAGADFQYRNSDIGNGKRLLTDFYFERSYSDVRDDDNTFGVAIVYPNEPWFFDLYAKQIGKDFMPALGFVNRTNVREYNNKITRRTRLNNSAIRWFELGTVNDIATTLGDRLQSRRTNLTSSLQTNTGDSFTFNVFNKFEDLEVDFTLPGRLIVPRGRHSWSGVNPRFETSAARPLFASWAMECCAFYDGSLLSNELQLNYRPSGTYDIAVRHVLNRIKMNQQAVNIHIGSVELGIQFTPDMQLKMQVQYDNISQRFRALLRYKWEPMPGTEVFAAVGEDAVASSPLLDSRYYSQRSEALLRLGHRLQF